MTARNTTTRITRTAHARNGRAASGTSGRSRRAPARTKADKITTEAVSTPVAPERRRELIALELILDNPHNVRFELGDLTELVESIGRIGLLKDPIVVPLPDGTYLPIDGNRRRAASLQAGLTAIYCVVADDLATPDGMPTAEQYATMLEAALPQEGLTRHERAAAYVQMCAFEGMTPTRVAARLGVDAGEVKEAVAASKLPHDVQAVFFSRQLTLDDALALSQVEAENPKAYEKLVRRLASGQGSYVITEEKHRLALAQAKKDVRAELAEAGVRIVADPGWHFPRETVIQPVANLRDKRHRSIGQAKHTRCPGHAAFLRTTGRSKDPLEVVHVCTDPEKHGHTLASGYPGREQAITKAAEATLTPAEIAERDAADEESRIAWAAAGEARRAWLGRIVRAKSLNATLARVALGAPRPHWQSAIYAHALLTGKPEGEDAEAAQVALQTLAASAPVANLHRHTVAYYVADLEDDAVQLDIVDRSPWRRTTAAKVAAWLTQLTELGYQSTDVEQQLVEQFGTGTAPSSEHDEESDEESDDTDSDSEETAAVEEQDAATEDSQADEVSAA